MINLVQHPSEQQWSELLDQCLGSEDDLQYINCYPFAGMKIHDANALVCFLKNRENVWLIEEEGLIKGFLNYGEVIPGHKNAFGMVIGKKYSGQGLGNRSLAEFIRCRNRYLIGAINGYCHRENHAMIAIMEKNGMTLDPLFHDPRDQFATKYTLVL